MFVGGGAAGNLAVEKLRDSLFTTRWRTAWRPVVFGVVYFSGNRGFAKKALEHGIENREIFGRADKCDPAQTREIAIPPETAHGYGSQESFRTPRIHDEPCLAKSGRKPGQEVGRKVRGLESILGHRIAASSITAKSSGSLTSSPSER